MNTQRRITLPILMAIVIIIALAILPIAKALADNVTNDVVANQATSITLTAGDTSSSVDVQFWVQPTGVGSDGDPGCNFDTTSEKLTFTINAPSNVIADPSSLTFNKCKDGNTTNAQTVHFTANPGAVSGDLSFTTTYNNSGGTFTYTGAAFYVNVVNLDTTAPVITPNVSGTLGNNGWYVSDVTVSWTISDPDSAITSSSGCDGSTTIGADTTGTTLSCTATSVGGTSSESVTIKRDATAPTISGSASPAANGAGWNNTDVTVSFDCTDATSGIASCTDPVTLSAEAAGQSADGTAVDNAGNSASTTVGGINIDKTAPTVNTNVSPAANSYGWNNTDVTVKFTGSDALSGIDFCDIGVVLSNEGANQPASGTCTDKAGNVSEPATVNVNIDKTAPSITDLGATSSPNGANGWYISAVTNTFKASDNLSGFGGNGNPYQFTVSTGASEGSDVKVNSGSVTDLAGNTAAAIDSATFKVDLSNPTNVSFTGGPADGASYYFGFVPATPSCTAEDAVSGLASCVVSGYSTAVGQHTLTATATDNAGRTATATKSYTVLAWTLTGFFQPVDMSPSAPTTIVWNTVKNGSTVPFKFTLFAGPTELTNTGYVNVLNATKIVCSTGVEDVVEQLAPTGGTSLRYDATAHQFVYNWQTPKLANSCYKVTIGTQDGSSLSAYFKLK